jgi:hypothetical protein
MAACASGRFYMIAPALCREQKPRIRDFICRNELVHQPIVCRPAHPLRFVRIFVVRWIAAELQRQLSSAPHGPVMDGLPL